ncbi:hypothetical protein D3C71_1987920 [compost metagenome]
MLQLLGNGEGIITKLLDDLCKRVYVVFEIGCLAVFRKEVTAHHVIDLEINIFDTTGLTECCYFSGHNGSA